MRTILVLICDDETGVLEMISAVQSLQRQQSITVSDAAYLIRRKDGGLTIKQAHSLVGVGSLGGVFWGLLVGQHIMLPWQTESAAKFRDVDALPDADCGVEGDFLSQVSHAIKPGYSALFMLVVYLTEETVAELSRHDVTLMYTALSSESNARLRQVLGILERVD